MNSKESLVIQARSLALYYFLDEYNELEELLIACFKREFQHVSPETLNLLYFYSGSKGSFYLFPNELSIKGESVSFDKDRHFSKFTLNELLKIDAKTKMMPYLDQRITLKQSNIEMSVRDCVQCFLRMRNRLAHRIHNVSFQNGDYVELLSEEHILDSDIDYDFGIYKLVMDDITKQVLSNVIYMVQILTAVKKEYS